MHPETYAIDDSKLTGRKLINKIEKYFKKIFRSN